MNPTKIVALQRLQEAEAFVLIGLDKDFQPFCSVSVEKISVSDTHKILGLMSVLSSHLGAECFDCMDMGNNPN